MRLILAFLLLFVSPAFAQTQTGVIPGHMSVVGCPGSQTPCFIPYALVQPLGYQQITSLSAATSLTVPTGATTAIIQAETQTVRWRDDGTVPTASVGMPLLVGATMVYSGPLSALSFIETTTSAKLDILYYK